MIANRNFGNSGPLTWIGQLPVYLSTALAIAHGVALIVCALAMAAGLKGLVDAFAFTTSQAVGGLHLWQFATCAFVYNNPGIYLGAAIQIILLAMFGQEVEKFIGRKQFACLYVALILVVPIFLMLMGFVGWDVVAAGSSGGASFAIFLAFAFIYPRVQIFFGIETRWIAILLFGILTLMYLASHAWVPLGTLWLEGAVVLFWMAKEGVRGMALPALSFKSFAANRNSKKHLKIVRREIDAVEEDEEEESTLHESIDPILDKIAKSGIGSLTRSEREKLERARVALLEKEGRR